MVDVVDSLTRSRMMSAIRGSNTKPELLVRRYLHAAGLRFRLHGTNLPGRPDIVLPRYDAAVFVHGCFWHRHQGCPFATTPQARYEFWQEKFRQNMSRDHRVAETLREMGWRVFTVWECEVENEEVLDRLYFSIVTCSEE
ncbi:DNA mismatch endonuclease Vsr [Ramlibacter sp. USB13]|uniref:Very short patch repair endonuclease n=1 Tax=Ramlibacter cellulosilyticus TaxID=2764187 RepID=A0A923SAC6_9BURK|nr:DNA mismatch endonuclease Vsr [Ramlibacter cellulosilyticus]